MARIRTLVLDNDEINRVNLEKILEENSEYYVLTENSVTGAIIALSTKKKFDLILVNKKALKDEQERYNFSVVYKLFECTLAEVRKVDKDLLERMTRFAKITGEKLSNYQMIKIGKPKMVIDAGSLKDFDYYSVPMDSNVLVHEEWGDVAKLAFFRRPDLGGGEFEAVSLKDGDDFSICVSCQTGCVMKCGYCATGHIDVEKIVNLNLTDFCWALQTLEELKKYRLKPYVVLLQGMGEPLFNLRPIEKLIEFSSQRRKFRLATTVPSVKLFKKFKKIITGNEDVKNKFEQLQISLHFPNNELRRLHMPKTDKVSILEIMNEAQSFFDETGIEVCFNYAVFRGINDSDEIIEQWIQLLQGKPFTLRPTLANAFGQYQPVSMSRMEEIRFELLKGQISCKDIFVSGSVGDKGNGACGKMALNSNLDESMKLYWEAARETSGLRVDQFRRK